MKAVVVTAPGVQIQDVPTPTPKANEVLIRVRSCGLNRADLMVASGMAHGRAGGAGTIVGLEFVGEVAGLGDAVVQGKLRIPIDSVYPFEQVTEALAHMKANQHFGKIVLEGPTD